MERLATEMTVKFLGDIAEGFSDTEDLIKVLKIISKEDPEAYSMCMLNLGRLTGSLSVIVKEIYDYNNKKEKHESSNT